MARSMSDTGTVTTSILQSKACLPSRPRGTLASLWARSRPLAFAAHDEFLHGARYRGFEVQQLGPFRRDSDAGHLLVKRAHLRFERLKLLLRNQFSRAFEAFERYAVDDVYARRAAHQQYVRRMSIGIDRQCHLRVLLKSPHLVRVRRGAYEDATAVPVEANGYGTRKPVGPGVRHPGRNGGAKQLLRERLVQYPDHILLSHAALLSSSCLRSQERCWTAGSYPRDTTPEPNVFESTRSNDFISPSSSKRRLPPPRITGCTMSLSSLRSPIRSSDRTRAALPMIVMSLPGCRLSVAIFSATPSLIRAELFHPTSSSVVETTSFCTLFM